MHKTNLPAKSFGSLEIGPCKRHLATLNWRRALSTRKWEKRNGGWDMNTGRGTRTRCMWPHHPRILQEFWLFTTWGKTQYEHFSMNVNNSNIANGRDSDPVRLAFGLSSNLHTKCPRSSVPFSKLSYYIKWVTILLGHTVWYLSQKTGPDLTHQ